MMKHDIAACITGKFASTEWGLSHAEADRSKWPPALCKFIGALSSTLTFWYRSLLHNLLKGVIDKLALD